MEDENDIIQFKITARDSHQKRLVQSFLQLTKGGDRAKNYKDFQRSVSHYCHSILSKLQISYDTTEYQLQEFKDQQQDLQNKIAAVENEILDFKNVFDHEYEEKQNREEYDNLFRVITEFPSRSETEAEIELLNKEIQALEEENNEIENQYLLRSNQFQLVIFAIEELSKTFGLEEENVNRATKRLTPPEDTTTQPNKRQRVV